MSMTTRRSTPWTNSSVAAVWRASWSRAGTSWRGFEEAAATEVARQWLLDARARAEAKAGRKLDWSDRGREVSEPWWRDAFATECLVTDLTPAALVVVGAVTVIGWIS
jgi:hypothetical protein